MNRPSGYGRRSGPRELPADGAYALCKHRVGNKILVFSDKCRANARLREPKVTGMEPRERSPAPPSSAPRPGGSGFGVGQPVTGPEKVPHATSAGQNRILQILRHYRGLQGSVWTRSALVAEEALGPSAAAPPLNSAVLGPA